MQRGLDEVKKDLRKVKFAKMEATRESYPDDEIEKLKEEETRLKRELFGARLGDYFERMGERNEKHKRR